MKLIDHLQVKIPFELALHAVRQRKIVTHYETNTVIKALDSWLVLKAETESSLIQEWNDQKKHLFTICKCSETIFRERLKLLKQMQVIEYDSKIIRLCSWERLGELLNIDVDQKLTIQYNVHDKQRVQEWLIATEIKRNKSSQAYMILKNLNKNPEQMMIVRSAIVKAGADISRLNDTDYFLSRLLLLYQNDFIQASDIHDLLIKVRPDTNRGIRGISRTWINNPMLEEDQEAKAINRVRHTVCYWKKLMADKGIISVRKINVQSNTRARNPYCRVLWLDTDHIRKIYPGRRKKQTLLCMPDQIELLTPW